MWLWCALQCFRVDRFVQGIYRVALTKTPTAPDTTNVNLPQHKSCIPDPSPRWSALALFKQLKQEVVIIIPWAVLAWFKLLPIFCFAFVIVYFSLYVSLFSFSVLLLNTWTWQCAKKCQRLKLFMFVSFNCKFIDRDIVMSRKRTLVKQVITNCQISLRLRQQIFPKPFLWFEQSLNRHHV